VKAIIWAAVSSEPQTERSGKQSIPEQVAQARAYIEEQGWSEIADPLIIDGHSRSYGGVSPLTDAATELPQYATLLQLAKGGKIDVLVCRGRDRLGRTSALVSTLEQYLVSHQVQILSLDMPTRILTPKELREGQARGTVWTVAIESARSQDEILTLQARRRSGMRRRCRQGYHSGKPPYGYRINPQTNIAEVVDGEAEVVRLVFSWFLQGESYRQIRQRLPLYAVCKIPSRRNISKIVENIFYTGKTRWGYESLMETVTGDGLHEAIIDSETWEAAQLEVQRRREQGKRTFITTNVLTGFVWCVCGAQMTIRSTRPYKTKRYRYYRCVDGCKHGYNVDRLENEVREELTEWITHPEALRQQLEETSVSEHLNETGALERSLGQHRDAIEVWSQDYQLGLIGRAEYYTRRTEIEEEIEKIQNELTERSSRRKPDDVVKDMEELAARAEHSLEQAFRDPVKAKELKAIFRRNGLSITVLKRDLIYITLLP